MPVSESLFAANGSTFADFSVVIESMLCRERKLTGMQARVMELRRLNFTKKEIASLLNISEIAVRDRITRAKRRMRSEPKPLVRIENLGNRAA